MAKGRRRFTDEQELAICEGYLSGATADELGDEFECNRKTVYKIMRRREVDRRRPGSQPKYTCDRHFFDCIDTEEKAYWLGFLGADGNVSGYTLTVALAARDYTHLLRLRTALQSNHPIKGTARELAGQPYHQNRLQLCSKHLVDGLAAHGVGPQKTFVLEWPHSLATSQLRHYLRGYMDGDGGFYFHKNNRGPEHPPNLVFSLCGTEDFCLGAQSYLMNSAKLAKIKLNPRGNVRLLDYRGNLQVSRIYRLLYDDATVWLPRKREKIANYVRPA